MATKEKTSCWVAEKELNGYLRMLEENAVSDAVAKSVLKRGESSQLEGRIQGIRNMKLKLAVQDLRREGSSPNR